MLQQIRDAFDQPLTVETLARTAGMSRYHFSRAFKAQLGHSPYAFLTETRLLRAAATLRRKRDVPVTVAALEAGFSDLGRFARAFRRRFGATPTRYRAAAGEVS